MAGSDRASCAAGACVCLSALATVIVAALLLVVVIGAERAPLAERLTRGDAVAMQVAGAVSCGLCVLCSGVVAGQARRRDAVQLDANLRAGTSSTRPPLHAERAADAGRLDANAKDERALELHAGTPTARYIVWKAMHAAKRALRV